MRAVWGGDPIPFNLAAIAATLKGIGEIPQ